MAATKKITRKKLKEPDEFIHFTERIFIYVRNHLKKIISGGIVLLIILLCLILFYRSERKKENDADLTFSSALGFYQMVDSSQQERTPLEYKKIIEKFEEVATKYPRTSSGRLSLLYKGNIHLKLSEFEESIKAYQTFIQKDGGDKLYRLLAIEGLGYAYEGKKDYEKALHYYQNVLEMKDHFHLAETYLNMGRCYEKLGKKEEALNYYKKFLDLSPKSQKANAILRKISLLEK